jgi:hypothetical protein
MKRMALAAVIALGMSALAGCDQKQTPQPGGGASAPQQSNTPSTPANAGTPSAAEKKSGANPVQGQVDPKQSEQNKDFQQRGDGAGPKPGG